MAEKGINRRSFVRAAVAGGMASMIPWRVEAQSTANKEKPAPTVQYRVLGRTGLKVSVIGFGAMRTSDPNVIHHALDLGVNYIDTAVRYMDGNNEIIVGNVLKTRRKEVFIATKFPLGTEADMNKNIDKSLKSLQTDVIDVMQLHSMSGRHDVLNQEAMNVLAKARQQGKIRFLGFTTHKNQVECLEAGIEAKFYDMVLVTYNFKSDAAFTTAIEKVTQAGIGVVAMKTQAGGYEHEDYKSWSPHQAALRWVLKNSNVATTIPGMVSFSQVDDNIQAMATAFGARDAEILQRYSDRFDGDICRLCGSCDSNCRHGLPIQDLSRTLMYAEGYRDYDLAIRSYQEIAAQVDWRACDRCGECTVNCKYGLNVAERMTRLRQNIGVLAS